MCCHGDQHPSTTSVPWTIIHHLLASSFLNHWHLSPYLPWILDLFHCHCDLTLRIPGPLDPIGSGVKSSDGTTSCKELQEILSTVVMNHHVESCNCRTFMLKTASHNLVTVESSSCPPSLTFKFASLRFWNSPTYELLRWIYGCSFRHSGKRPRRRVAAEATRSSRWNKGPSPKRWSLKLSTLQWLENNHPNAGGWSAGVTNAPWNKFQIVIHSVDPSLVFPLLDLGVCRSMPFTNWRIQGANWTGKPWEHYTRSHGGRSKKRPVSKRNGWRVGQGWTANLCVKIWSNEVHFPTSSSCVRKKLDDDTTFRATMLRLPLTTSFKVYLLPCFSKMPLLLSIQVLPLFIPSTFSLILKLAHQPNHSSIKVTVPSQGFATWSCVITNQWIHQIRWVGLIARRYIRYI